MCIATRLSSCVASSRGFATSALIQRCTQLFPKGEMTGTVTISARAMRASAWSSLLLALAVFVVHSSFSLITESSNYGLCALNTLVTSPTAQLKLQKIGIHFIGTTFCMARSVCLSSTTHRIFSILSRARYNHVRNTRLRALRHSLRSLSESTHRTPEALCTCTHPEARGAAFSTRSSPACRGGQCKQGVSGMGESSTLQGKAAA